MLAALQMILQNNLATEMHWGRVCTFALLCAFPDAAFPKANDKCWLVEKQPFTLGLRLAVQEKREQAGS